MKIRVLAKIQRESLHAASYSVLQWEVLDFRQGSIDPPLILQAPTSFNSAAVEMQGAVCGTGDMQGWSLSEC